ncbi:RsmB/NOP family class I SAM-dependent RNA methyltransferase [Oceaniglobus indicus]|uniref:RsmB/NOP family class I SAM-dependent RNA methyltransferase n=1 Tax=Oceaniglobus indicus TaxID=2047749 RepID=UPI000C182784|nr:RsmB/NOP family class I SAM-dependent RNA methyltransferase [Oceaniglobus indicus]
MTPAARISAAIQILDIVMAGDSAERVLTTWGRQNRFAGSGDRAAIRDHVFDALRRLRSAAARGGGMDGRRVMLGLLRERGLDPGEVFTGIAHAPAPLRADEIALPLEPGPLEALDCPEWLAPALQASLGDDFTAVMRALRDRAPLFLRVNLRKGNIGAAQQALVRDEIETRPHPLSPTALEVLSNPRRLQNSDAYRSGLVEIQDAASQAVADAVPLSPGVRVLDYCAGGGGKTLAMAARCDARFFAHDADRARMSDVPARAERAGVSPDILAPGTAATVAPFDVVLVDAPCSGSGAWRRSPQGKWRLDDAALAALCALQARILSDAAALVRTGGALAYATCSLLDAENRGQIDLFLASNPGWSVVGERRLTPLDGGDGFYFCHLLKD